MSSFIHFALILLTFIGMASAFAPGVAIGVSRSRVALRPVSCSASVTSLSMCSASGDRVAEIKEVMQELLEFRQRIVDDATSLAKKVKAKPRDLRKTLESHPDLLKIDSAVEQLEAELSELSSPA